MLWEILSRISFRVPYRAMVRATKCFHSIFWSNWSNSDKWQRSTTTTNYIDWQFQPFSICFLLNPVVRLIDKNLLWIDAIIIELIRFINSTVEKSIIAQLVRFFVATISFRWKGKIRNLIMQCQRMSIVVQQPRTKASNRKRWQQRRRSSCRKMFACEMLNIELGQHVHVRAHTINWQWWSSVCWKTSICIT